MTAPGDPADPAEVVARGLAVFPLPPGAKRAGPGWCHGPVDRGIFFTLIILGLASSLPGTLTPGLAAQRALSADAARLAARRPGPSARRSRPR